MRDNNWCKIIVHVPCLCISRDCRISLYTLQCNKMPFVYTISRDNNWCKIIVGVPCHCISSDSRTSCTCHSTMRWDLYTRSNISIHILKWIHVLTHILTHTSAKTHMQTHAHTHTHTHTRNPLLCLFSHPVSFYFSLTLNPPPTTPSPPLPPPFPLPRCLSLYHKHPRNKT